jgi:mediator of RNA polymerase II transcription subunit 14
MIFDNLFLSEFRKLCMNINFCHQLVGIPSTEPGVVNFKVESLQCRVGLNPQHLQSLHIKVSPLPDHKDQWSTEEMQVRKVFPRLLSFYSLLMWSEMYLK